MDERDILGQLDARDRDLDFPGLANVNYPLATARLTAFRGPDEWLIAFEIIAYAVKEGGFVNVVFAYGNRLEEPGWQTQIPVVTPAPNQPIWDRKGEFLLDLSDFQVEVRGSKQTFSPTANDYARAGIRPDSEMAPPLQLIRFLAYLRPGQLFLTDSELLEAVGAKDSKAQRFLQLDDWRHPDATEDERPSTSPCLRTLAKALAAGNASLYECSDQAKNTHWSNWDV